jgi:hypothetical protein
MPEHGFGVKKYKPVKTERMVEDKLGNTIEQPEGAVRRLRDAIRKSKILTRLRVGSETSFRSSRFAWLLLFFCVFCCPAYADLKAHIVTHMTREDPERGNWERTSDDVIFISGDNVRSAPVQGNLVDIMHCGGHKGWWYQLDMLRKEYTKTKLNIPAEDAEAHQPTLPAAVESKTEDTGESREFFGRNARHLITHLKQTRGNTTTEVTQDGWYLGLRWPAHKCPIARYSRVHAIGPTVNYGNNSVTFAHSGPVPYGPAVKFVESYTIRTVNAAGHQIEIKGSATMDILELSEAPLHPALFEPPQEFKKVRMLIYDAIQQERATPSKKRD